TVITRAINRVSCSARLLLSGAAALAVLGFSPAYAAPSFPAGSCAAQRAGSTIQCTANDVALTQVNITNANSCILGDDVTVSFNANITGGNAKRYDIGVFISD